MAISLFIILAMLLPVSGTSTAVALGDQKPAARDAICFNNGEALSTQHAFTGKVNFVGTDTGKPISNPAGVSASASAEEAARGYFGVCGSFFGLKDQRSELTLKRSTADELGRSTVRFQQVYNGIPVLGGELVTLTDKANNIISVAGEILPDIMADTNPTVDAAAAMQEALTSIAKQHEMNVNDLTASKPELWLYNPSLISPLTGSTRLVWRMDVTSRELAPIRELVLVDAQRGSVALNFNQVDTARNRMTYTAGNSKTLPGTLICNESDASCAAGDTDAKNAHKFAGDTYDFYKTYHNRDSINNAGMTLKSTVHYDSGYCNAFWNGIQMVYGDGCFIVVDDVVGHELTHGVTEYESGLFYYYQSGAINESFSDVWGEFVDLTNGKGTDTPAVRWLMGEDTSIGAIRNMMDPTAFSDPDKMTSPNYYTGDADSGGVHTNSGVNNKAAFLMTDGGTFNGKTVTGLGITKVAKIYYEAQRNLLVSGSDYLDLYNALYQACKNLVGTSGITSANCTQVRNATQAVEMDLQPVSGFNPEAPLCSSGEVTINKFFDNLEGGSGKWVFAATPGTNRWQLDSPYGSFAHSGSHFLYADDYPAAVTSTTATMKNAVVIPASAYLHFHHAYGFEGSNLDGGVIEYTTDGGTTWNDAGSLFDYNGYTGTISSSYGNPLGGRSAFVSDSHGYRSSRLNLSLLAGQTVSFRWRMGLDSSGYDWGWWLDDVRIYTCNTLQSATYKSAGTQDGWILESSETSNKGQTVNKTATTLRLGDDAAKKQYRSILSFNTAALPDTAVVTKVTLKVKWQGVVGGGNPVTTFQGFMADIKKGSFGTASLVAGDFQTAANKTVGPVKPALVGGWYSLNLTLGKSFVNKTGLTQIRLRFKLDDNNNNVANYLSLFSGNAQAASRPQLIIEYYIP